MHFIFFRIFCIGCPFWNIFHWLFCHMRIRNQQWLIIDRPLSHKQMQMTGPALECPSIPRRELYTPCVIFIIGFRFSSSLSLLYPMIEHWLAVCSVHELFETKRNSFVNDIIKNGDYHKLCPLKVLAIQIHPIQSGKWEVQNSILSTTVALEIFFYQFNDRKK